MNTEDREYYMDVADRENSRFGDPQQQDGTAFGRPQPLTPGLHPMRSVEYSARGDTTDLPEVGR